MSAFENDTKVSTVHTEDNTASIWMAIFGSMFGFLVFIIPFEDGKWDKDTVIGFIFFAFIALAVASCFFDWLDLYYFVCLLTL